jgi:hypothetical protein
MAKQSLLSIILRVKAKGFDAALIRAGKSLERFGSKATAAGKTLTTSLTAPLAAVAAVAGKTAVDFEFALAKVQAVSGFTAGEMGKLEAQAKALGASTSKSASEVAGLQLELAKLGKSQGEIEGMTEGILSLGIAFDEELGVVAAEVGATLNRFGLDASKTNGVVDVMAKAFGSSALDLDKFSNAMAKAGPTANGLGISLEDTTAALGVLVNNGIDASTAGTALTKAMTTLAKKGVEPSKILGTLFNGGLSVAESFELFGDRAGKIIPVLQANGQQFDELSTKLYNADGAAATARATLENTAQGALDRMRSAIEAAALSLSEFLLPAIVQAADFIGGLASKFASLDTETKKTILKFAGIAAAIGPALLVVGKFSGLIGTLLRLLPLVTGPVGLVAIAIGAAVIAIIKNWDAVVAYFRDGPGATFLDTLLGVVETVINGIVFVFSAAIDMIISFWNTWGETITNIVVGVVNGLGDIFGFLFEGIGSLFAAFKSAFEGDWSGMFKNLGNTLISSLQFIVSTLFNAFGVIGGLVDGVLEKFGVDSGIQSALDGVEKNVTDFLEGLKFDVEETEKSVFSLGETFSKVMGMFSGSSGGTGGAQTIDSGVEPGTGVGGDTGGDSGSAIESAETYNGILEETKTLAEQAGEASSQAFASLTDGLASAIVEGESFGETLKNVFKGLLKQLLSLAISYAITSALSPLDPANQVTGGAAGAAKAAAAPAIVKAFFASLPKFAQGGAVTGPTVALIGERPGSRGEFVIPFERLGQFMDMAGAGQSQTVNGRIYGDDIFLSNENSDRLLSRRRIIS